jgi:hypothetical protein
MLPNVSKYFATVCNSLSRLLALFAQPRMARRAVACLLMLQTTLLCYSGSIHTPSFNEPGHLVAGLSHWKFADFTLYCINPPLVRMVAALPVLVVEHSEDWSGISEGPGITGMTVFAMGEQFVAVNRERSNFLFMIARWACIPFSWLGAIVCYLWARDLYGRPAGVLACLLWCFEPNILANSAMITPDAHATALGLAACYSFWRWLRQPTWMRTIVSGSILGLAELAKTTLVLLYLIWPFIWAIYRWQDRREMQAKRWLREAAMLLTRMGIAIYVINLGYGFERTLQRLGDFQFCSELLTVSNGPSVGPTLTDENQPKRSNYFDQTILGAIPVPLPESYLLGMDIQRQTFETYPRPSYLAGKWQMGGWWYYYLYAISIKAPLALAVLSFLALWTSYRCFTRVFKSESGSRITVDHAQHSPTARDSIVLLAPAAVILIAVSAETGFSEHMRYVLPASPYCLIALTSMLRPRHKLAGKDAMQCVVERWHVHFPACGKEPLAIVALGVCWLVSSSLYVYPHSLSYFNELIGGPLSGHRYLHSSNIDWGQDLSYLVKWARQQDPKVPLSLAYYGYVPPGALGLAHAGPFDRPDNQDVAKRFDRRLAPGYYAISANLAIGLPWSARNGTSEIKPLSPWAVESVTAARPVARAGYSIWIYSLAESIQETSPPTTEISPP